MKLLLDTHALLWAIIAPEQLSAEARAAITDPAAQIAVSAVSFWEIAIKAGLGKLTLTGTTPEALVEAAQQLMGVCGERQIAGAEIALSHGNGGELSSQATVILGTEAAL